MDLMLSLNIKCMILGAIIFADCAASLFFLRFWKTTRDRFFLFFAMSFLLDAVSRLFLSVTDSVTDMTNTDYAPLVYTIRLFSFLLIIFAIVQKNWKLKGAEDGKPARVMKDP
ncbi:MAG: hypothetical protein JWO78_1462 [Micavibrio sp.]|nr:hypothetical protein [Micavibrio sp.]